MCGTCWCCVYCPNVLHRGGGAHLTSPFNNLSTAGDEEITLVENNKLGKDLEAQVFDPIGQNFQDTWNDFVAEAQPDIEARVSLIETFADDVRSWINDDGTVNDINSASDITGEGSQDSPYVIHTVRGWVWFYCKTTCLPMEKIAETPDYVYGKLGDDDIDFGAYSYDMPFTWTNSAGEEALVFGGFYGSLDGNGHGLVNVYIPQRIVGLFNFFGCSLAEDIVLFPQQSVLKDITFSGVINSSDEMSGILCAALYNSKLENVTFDFYGVYQYTSIVMTFIDDNYFINCNFNLTAAGPEVVSVTPFLMSMTFASLEPTVFENCTSTINAEGRYVSGFITMVGGALTMNNCKTYGYMRSIDDDNPVGGFIGALGGFDGSPDGVTIDIISCENHAALRGYTSNRNNERDYNVGGIVGCVGDGATLNLYNCKNFGVLSGEMIGGIVGGVNDADAVVNLSDCENRGDLYNVCCSMNVATGSGMNIKGGYSSGILNQGLKASAIAINGCENYGNIYSGAAQAGIVISNTDDRNSFDMSVTYCSNYGNLMYPSHTDVLPWCYSAGIMYGLADIVNCKNLGNFITLSLEESKRLGYVYMEAGTPLPHSGLSIACGISFMSTNIINCYNSCMIKNYMNAQGISMGANLMESCASYLKVEAGDLGCTAFGLCDKPQSLKNCYSEMYVNVKEEYAVNPQGYIMVYQFGVYGSPRVENVQGYCEVNMSSCPFIYEDNVGPSIEKDQNSFWMGLGLFSRDENPSFVVTPDGIADRCDNMKNVYLKTKTILAEGYDLSDPLSQISNWDVDNVVIDIDVTSGKNNRHEKWLIDNDETTTFDGEEWFYTQQLNGAVPMLRQFFWQQQFTQPQDDVLAQLERLGFAGYEAA